MRGVRFSAWLLLVALAGPTNAQSVELIETPAAKECVQVGMSLKLNGERIYFQEGRQTQKVTATAGHRYTEKVLGIEGRGGLASKVARHYSTAQSTLDVAGVKTTNSLRSERSVTVAQRTNEGFVTYSLGGPLTREELELIGGQFDSMSIAGLVPGKAVKVGETWKLSNHAVQGLCGFEGLISHELTGKLESVSGGQAVLKVSGKAIGVDLGAQVTLTVDATATFDLAQKRIVRLSWKQDDERDQGPASPGFKAEISIDVTREAAAEPRALADAALEAVPQGFDVPAALTTITYRDPMGRFELAQPRDWQLTGATSRHTVFRLLDRGDFVAQATVTPWDAAEAGKQFDAKQFKEAMLASPGWEAGEVLQEGEIQTGQPGRFVYRVSASGAIDDMKVVQTFFLVTNPSGQQVVIAFSMKQPQMAKLGVRDLAFVEGITLTGKK